MFDDRFINSLSEAASFEVLAEGAEMPSVMLRITMTREADEGLIAGCCVILGDYYEKYNMLHFLKPMGSLSDAAEVAALSDTDVCVRLDLGEAHPFCLVGAVRALAESGLPIVKIVIE